MLVATVELWPYGDTSRAKTLVTVSLANVGQSPSGFGHSYIWTIDEPKPLVGSPIKAQGVVEEYDRDGSCVDMLHVILSMYSRGATIDEKDLTEYQRGVVTSLREKVLDIS